MTDIIILKSKILKTVESVNSQRDLYQLLSRDLSRAPKIFYLTGDMTNLNAFIQDSLE